MTLTLPQTPVLWGIAGVFAILVVASIVVFVLVKARPARDYGELKARISSWWVMVSVLSVAIVLSPLVSVVFLGFVSFLALTSRSRCSSTGSASNGTGCSSSSCRSTCSCSCRWRCS
jgi:predicted CDP-diglyceride synthetase/phosphatidate cytidylyltransferase